MNEATLTPQAPLDLGRLELAAKEAGTKYVANLLQVWTLSIDIVNVAVMGVIKQISSFWTLED